jgi:ankyrin repeat protein
MALVSKFLASQFALASSNQVVRYGLGYRDEYWDAEECLSFTPLHLAAYFGMTDLAAQCLESGIVSVDLLTKMGTTPLIYAASRGQSEVMMLLLARGADPYLTNWYGNALHCAAEAGHSNTIKDLIRYGVDPNSRGFWGKTPLHCTTDQGHGEAAKTLIAGGAAVDICNDEGLSVFHLAVSRNAKDVWHHLLARRLVDVNSPTAIGATALHLAARHNDAETVLELLKGGANPNIRDGRELTACHYAPHLASLFREYGYAE